MQAFGTAIQTGKDSRKTAVAIARQLLDFIWDIVCHEMPKIQHQAS